MATRDAKYSYPEKGTIEPARIIAQQTPPSICMSPFDLYGINIPHPHEEVSGDGWTSRLSDERCLLMVVDGLGHGPSAAEAAQEALATFRQTTSTSPAHIIEDIHGALRSTRGAVAAVAEVDLQRREVSYAGIGNISATIIMHGGVKRMVSHNGTLGSNMRKVMDMPSPFPHGSLLVMHSDGIGTHWSIDAYPGLMSQGSGLIAGALYRDHNRHRDDATVVVLQEKA
jgi:serine phosphatase RsbU (regulator of sigma subunit)